MKRRPIAVLAAAVVLAAPSTGAPPRAAGEELRLVVVDLRRAVAESSEGRKATADLKQMFDKKQKELTTRENEMRAALADLEKKRSLISPEALRQRETELQGRAQALQQLLARHQEELSRNQAERLDPVLRRLQQIVQGMATAQSFSVVLDRASAVVFARPHLDITDELIRRFNAGEGGTGTRGSSKPTGR
jgi:outer membrane protein